MVATCSTLVTFPQFSRQAKEAKLIPNQNVKNFSRTKEEIIT